PVGHEVVGQAGQVEFQRAAEGVQVFGVAGVAVAQHAAVNAPGLAAGPETVVPVALAGGAVAGGAGGVHEEGVVGGAVGPEGVGQAGGDVPVGDVGVLCVAGDLAGPVEQRQVQQAVDDVAVVFRRAHLAPGLDELALGLEAADELVGGQDGGVPGGGVAGE